MDNDQARIEAAQRILDRWWECGDMLGLACEISRALGTPQPQRPVVPSGARVAEDEAQGRHLAALLGFDYDDPGFVECRAIVDERADLRGEVRRLHARVAAVERVRDEWSLVEWSSDAAECIGMQYGLFRDLVAATAVTDGTE